MSSTSLWNRIDLIGGNGNDTVFGGLGDDVIDSGLGNDTVSGGGGTDTFIDAGGTDQLIEGFDLDFGLYGNLLVIGTGGGAHRQRRDAGRPVLLVGHGRGHLGLRDAPP